VPRTPAGSSRGTEVKGDGVYNQVEGQTTIVFVKPAGSQVKKGELVCELESFNPKSRLAKQEAATRAAESANHSARGSRELAELAATEYLEGTFKPQLKRLDNEVSLAELDVKRAEQSLATIKNLFDKGLTAKSQVEAAELKLQQTRLALDKSQGKRTTLEKFTKEKKLKEFQSKVEKARAEELATQAEHGREQAVEEQLKKQVEHCKMLAPATGRVVYFEPLEAGAEASQGQLMFRVVPESESKAKPK
jgi:multidrug resistance efflux pump